MRVRLSSTDDVEIELHQLGGDGPPLLIAHATGFCAGPYRPLAAGLTDRFRVLALDFRAHGRSSRPTDGNLDWNGMMDDVLTVVDHLGEPVHAFGHSMGGACLLGAEARRPGILRAAWVFEPIIIPREFQDGPPGGNPLAESARRRRPTFPSRPDALHRYAGRPPLGVFRADALWHYVDDGFADDPDGSVTLRCRPEDESATFDAPGKPTPEQLEAVTVPVTLAIGGRDPSPGPADFGRHAVSFLPRGELLELPDLGHFGPFQDPDRVADEVLATFTTPTHRPPRTEPGTF